MSRYGQLRLWGSVGYVFMTAASGFVLDWTGIGLMPWVGAAILGAVLVVSLCLYQTPQALVAKKMVSVWQVMSQREVIAFMVSGCFMLAAHSALYAFYSLYLSVLGYSSVTIGIMWAIGASAEIIFFIYQAPIMKRFGIKVILLTSLFLAVVRFALIGFGAESFIILLIAQILACRDFRFASCRLHFKHPEVVCRPLAGTGAGAFHQRFLRCRRHARRILPVLGVAGFHTRSRLLGCIRFCTHRISCSMAIISLASAKIKRNNPLPCQVCR